VEQKEVYGFYDEGARERTREGSPRSSQTTRCCSPAASDETSTLQTAEILEW
jgi:hypothetical protein